MFHDLSTSARVVIAIIVGFVLLDAVLLVQFVIWRNKRIRELGFAHCAICDDFAKVCCRDDDGEFPRCFECCDHTRSPAERE